MSHKNKIHKTKTYIIYAIITIFLLILLTIVYQNNSIKLLVENKNIKVENFKPEIQNILKMQREEGTKSIMKIDCNTLELEKTKEYCTSQQKMFNK
jgi:hypothetical protein